MCVFYINQWILYRNHQLDQQKNNVGDAKNNGEGGNAADKKKPHIKKPLNAFMLYMKEMRAKVVAECTLKESAAINQILGRRVSGLQCVFLCRFCVVQRESESEKLTAEGEGMGMSDIHNYCLYQNDPNY